MCATNPHLLSWQDAQATCPGCSDDMAWTDVEKFLEENL
jgi:hypothetical protein